MKGSNFFGFMTIFLFLGFPLLIAIFCEPRSQAQFYLGVSWLLAFFSLIATLNFEASEEKEQKAEISKRYGDMKLKILGDNYAHKLPPLGSDAWFEYRKNITEVDKEFKDSFHTGHHCSLVDIFEYLARPQLDLDQNKKD